MKDKLMNEYFEWMYRLIFSGRENGASYRKLLCKLHDTEFTYSIAMDGNRAEDGVDLRYRFGNEKKKREASVASCLDVFPCSVLEMMVALAIRLEEQIMDNPDIGDRTGEWFMGMVESLGLGGMDDGNFDRRAVAKALERLLSRSYKKNGEGGLFTVKRRGIDMREVEIWCQAMWHLDDVLKG